ncbi:MAG: hypothetical protein ABI721_01450 [Candidatus Dojkabacteria bacterium]
MLDDAYNRNQNLNTRRQELLDLLNSKIEDLVIYASAGSLSKNDANFLLEQMDETGAYDEDLASYLLAIIENPSDISLN